MVPFGLVGISFREVGYRAIEALALAEVAGDLHAVPGAGVRPGQRPAAEAGIDDQFIGRHALDVSRAFHVLQLAPVEVASSRATKPAEEDVARGLHQPLAGHDAVSVVLVSVGLDVGLEYRGTGLLDLEEQGVILVAPFKQYYVGPGAHASDPHNLPRRIHKAVPVEQVPTIFLQGALVVLQNGVYLCPDLVFLGDAHQERRIVVYHAASVDDPGQLGECLQAVAATRLPHGLAQLFRGLLPGLGIEEHPADFLLANARVPDLELSHLRELGHPLPVGGHGRLRGLAAIGCVEAVFSASDHEARGEAFDVPLPRPGQGLVEVVEVEEQGALRGGIRPKVQKVGVAAKLSLDAGLRGASEVLGHDDGRPPHEGERRSHHARVPDRDELLNPVPVLCLQEVDRIRPIRRRYPLRVAAPWSYPTRGAPEFVTLLVARDYLRRRKREVRVLLAFHGFLLCGSKILLVPGMRSSSGRRTACGTVSASLAVLRGVEVAPVGFQRRLDSLQDIALLQGQSAYSSVAQSTKEQVGYLQPQRRFGRIGHQRFLNQRDPISVFFHIVYPLLRRARLRAVLLALGERRLCCAQYAKAPQERTNRCQWPGDEARETGAQQRRPEQDAARRGGDGVLVRLQRSSALLDESGHHPRDGGSRPRAAADNAGARPTVAGVHPPLGSHPPALPRSFQADLPAVGDVVLEELLHPLCEVRVFYHQVDLPVGDEAAEVQVRRAHLRPPAVCHYRLGVDHGATVLEDPDPRLQELPVAGARGPAYPGYVVGGRRENPHVHAVTRRGHQRLSEDRQGEEVRIGYPEPILHPGREELQHTQGTHPAWFLDDQAGGRLPRRLDILRVRALIVGQLLHQLAPQAGEGTVDVGHHRSPHADRGVPVGKPRLLGADHPAVGDAHAACRGVLAVNDEQLAVVAPNSPERRSRGGWVDRLDLHAGLPHALPEGTRHVHATEPVVQYPHAHALLGFRGKGLGEPVSDLIVLEDVVVEVDPTLSPGDGSEPVVVCVRAVS